MEGCGIKESEHDVAPIAPTFARIWVVLGGRPPVAFESEPEKAGGYAQMVGIGS